APESRRTAAGRTAAERRKLYAIPLPGARCSPRNLWILVRTLRDQQHLSGRLPPRQRLVRLGRILQRELGADAHRQFATTDPIEQVCRPRFQFGAGEQIVVERRPREEERAFAIQDLWIDRRHRPARLAEQYEHAALGECIERLVEGRFADRVVDDLNARTVGDAARFRREILGRVVDHVIGASLPRELALLFGRRGADDEGAALFCDLAEQETDAARRGVDERTVAA